MRGQDETVPGVGPVNSGRARLPRSAVTSVERVAWARLRLYELYDADSSSVDALDRFRQEWWAQFAVVFRCLDDCLPDLPDAEERLHQAARSERVKRYRDAPADLAKLTTGDWARRYLEGLARLADDLGLNRIPIIGTPPIAATGYLPSGTAQAHRFLWHLDKRILFERAVSPGEARGTTESPRPTFMWLASFGTLVPKVDLSIAGTDARWDPRTEFRSDALRRLRRRRDLEVETIKRELARISLEGAYEFPDTITERAGVSRADRDAQWVWWRLRFRWPYRKIAEEWGRLHPGDILLRERRVRQSTPASAAAVPAHPSDSAARARRRAQMAVTGEREPFPMEDPAEAVGMVRKAVRSFAGWARVDVTT